MRLGDSVIIENIDETDKTTKPDADKTDVLHPHGPAESLRCTVLSIRQH